MHTERGDCVRVEHARHLLQRIIKSNQCWVSVCVDNGRSMLWSGQRRWFHSASHRLAALQITNPEQLPTVKLYTSTGVYHTYTQNTRTHIYKHAYIDPHAYARILHIDLCMKYLVACVILYACMKYSDTTDNNIWGAWRVLCKAIIFLRANYSGLELITRSYD